MNPTERAIQFQSSFGIQPVKRKQYRYFAAALGWLLVVSPGFAQDAASPQNQPQPSQPKQMLVLPAGTRIPLTLQRGMSTRNSRPGDMAYLLTTAPVVVGDRAVIPPDTFVQGTIAELAVPGIERDGMLRIHSVHLVFANGYTVGVTYDVALRLDRQWIYPEPPSAGKRAGLIAALAAPAAGALIGGLASMHSPPPLTPPVPGQPLTTPNLGDPVKGAAIGFVAGLAVTIPVTVSILRHHKDFFIEGGVPSEMILEAPLAMEADQIAGLRASAPPAPALPPSPPPRRTCYTAGIPAAPDIIIAGTPPVPGTPAMGDIPGTPGTPGTPDTVIPGRPAIPGSAYPCP